MKYVRLILGIIVTLVVLTFTIEVVEFLIVKSTSGKSMEYLTKNQSEYFSFRNQNWILVLKIIYTFISAFLAGWLGIKIVGKLQYVFLITIVSLQSLSFIYAMFFSEFKDTLHTFYWLLLLLIVLIGIYIGVKSVKNK